MKRLTRFKYDALRFYESTTKSKIGWREVGIFITFDVKPYKKLRSNWTSFKITPLQLKNEIGKICGF